MGIGRRLSILVLSLVIAAGVLRCMLTLPEGYYLHDFSYLWLAGRTWAEGLSPYSADYGRVIESLPEASFIKARPYLFYYPPNWSAFVIPLSFLPLSVAGIVWTGLNLLMLTGSQIAIYFSISEKRRNLILLLVALAFCFALNGTKFNFRIGQTSILVMFAFSIMILGVARNSFALRAIGIALVMLKPNIGMILVAPMLLYDFRSVIAGAVLTLLLSIPAFLIESPMSIGRQLAMNIASYGDFPVNMVAAQTGLSSIIYAVTGADTSPILLSLLGACLSLLLFAWYWRQEEREHNPWFGYLWIGSAAAAFMVRFHMHDMVIIALIVQPLALSGMSLGVRCAAVAGLLSLWKPEGLAIFLKFYAEGARVKSSNFFGANLVTSIGMMFVVLALLMYLYQLRTRRGAYTVAV